MSIKPLHFSLTVLLFIAPFCATPAVYAQYWTSYSDNTRYLALGDSLSAGYGAHPATNGFVYQLYQSGAIDNMNNMLLCNIGISGATSQDVLHYQVPQARLFFSDTKANYRKVITLTVGGNDMLPILVGADPAAVLKAFGTNLGAILCNLTSSFPDARIYVANQYDPLLPFPNGSQLLFALNQAIDGVVSHFPQAKVVDVYGAFAGKSGLLLIGKNNGDPFQVHPTNAGHWVIAKAFEEAMRTK